MIVAGKTVDQIDAVPAVHRLIAAGGIERRGHLSPDFIDAPDGAVREHEALDVRIASHEPVFHGDLIGRAVAEHHVVADAREVHGSRRNVSTEADRCRCKCCC